MEPNDLTAELIRKAREALSACERERDGIPKKQFVTISEVNEGRLVAALALTLTAVEQQQLEIAKLKRRTRWLP